jgi:hypothetical protein
MKFKTGDTVKVKKTHHKFLHNGKGYVVREDFLYSQKKFVYTARFHYKRNIILPEGGLEFPNIQLTKMILLEKKCFKKWDLK